MADDVNKGIENADTDMHLQGIEEQPTVSPAVVAAQEKAEREALSEGLPAEPPVSPKKPVGKIIIFAAAGLLVLTALLITLRGPRRQQPASTPQASSVKADLARYSEDPDEDRIPSFIEQKLKFDPNVSELDRCFNSKCDSVNTETIKRIPRNVMILLDSSGSMQQKVGDQTKMESAKIAITEYLKKASALEQTKVGLIVYGHKGSNSTADKAASCASAEIKAPLGDLKLDAAPSILSTIQPVGWTPIGLGLREAVKSFQPMDEKNASGKKQASPAPEPSKVINEVVIISDGVETCDTNPVAVAKELYESKDNVVVHVIGFAVDSAADNKSLRDISQAAGGTYATAPTIDELKLAMDLQWDNYVRRAREDACKVRGYATFLACKDEALALVKAYISSELSRDPRELQYEEKLKIDRIRYVFPAYINGTLDPMISTTTPPATGSASPTSSSSPSPSPSQ